MRKIAATRNYQLNKRATQFQQASGLSPAQLAVDLNSMFAYAGINPSELDSKVLEAFQNLWEAKDRCAELHRECLAGTNSHNRSPPS